jgi:hypothetical protein
VTFDYDGNVIQLKEPRLNPEIGVGIEGVVSSVPKIKKKKPIKVEENNSIEP